MSVDFLGESRLVSPGLSRGGAEASVASPAGILSLYSSFDDTTTGLGSPSGAGNVRVRAARYSLPMADGRFAVALLGLWSDQEATPAERGGSGRVLGILAKLDFAPEFQVAAEAAQSRRQPGGKAAFQGNGFRLEFFGTVSGTTYSLGVRRIASTFANPADPGYTPYGVPDRTGGDLKLSRSFGKLSSALSLGCVKSGAGGGGTGALDGRQTHASLTLSLPATRTVLLSGTINGAWTSQDPAEGGRLPGMDQRMAGLSLTAVERLGDLSFSQTCSSQRLRDSLNPLSDSTVSTFVLTLGGKAAPALGIAATGAFTRTQAAGAAGRTDSLVLSVAPYWSLADLYLTVTPRLSYTRSLNSAGTADSHAELYQLSVAWSPAWRHSFLSLQGSAEMGRSFNALLPLALVREHRYTMSLVLRWGPGGGPLDARFAKANARPVLSPLPGRWTRSGT
jgi:hypothetical protein